MDNLKKRHTGTNDLESANGLLTPVYSEQTMKDCKREYDDFITFQHQVWIFYLTLFLTGIIFILWSILSPADLTVSGVQMEKEFIRLFVFPLYGVVGALLILFRKDYTLLSFVMMAVVFVIAYTLGLVTAIEFKSKAQRLL